MKNNKYKNYCICISSSYVRDAQIYQPEGDESWDTEDLTSSDFEKNWVDTERDLYLGAVRARNEEEAVERGSEKYGYSKTVLIAYDLENETR